LALAHRAGLLSPSRRGSATAVFSPAIHLHFYRKL
jgi:hypothetical protein